MKLSSSIRTPVLLALATGLASQAISQTVLEEVIVTAQKKAESLQDTPIAITAFGSDALEQRQAFGVADVGEYTPNATMTQSLGSSYNIRMNIRGLGTAEPSLAVDPKVGIYLDGVYIARNAGAVFDVVDLERMEVLRGPQGTLWGKNTTGGAVNMITAKPSGEWGFKQLLSTGNDGYYRATTTINTQEWAGLSAKLNVMYKGTDGWQDNTANTGKQNLGEDDTSAIHLALAWQSDIFSADYTYDRTDSKATPLALQVGTVNAAAQSPTVPTLNASNGSRIDGNPFYQMLAIADNNNRKDKFDLINQGSETLDASGHSLTLSAQLDHVEFKSITSYRKYKSDFLDGNHIDGGTYYGTAAGDTDPSWLPAFWTTGLKHQNQVSQEFQAIGDALNERLNYVLGLYYFNENGKESNPWIATFNTTSFLLDPNEASTNIFYPDQYGNFYRIKSESRAIYGQLTYDLTDRLSLTFGSRYSNDEKELTLTTEDPLLTATEKADHGWTETTFTGIIDYVVTDDMNVYFKVAEGYASGLFNPGVIDRNPTNPITTEGALTPVDPEETTAYEIGIKSMWLDQRLQFNGAVFYNDNDNLQITDFVDGIRVSFNSGSSDAKGVELEIVALLTEGLTMDASYGYLNMDFDDRARSQGSPKNTGTVGIQYELGMNFGLLTTRVDATYTDESYFSSTNRSVSADDRTLLNGRITLSEVELPTGQLQFALWGRNLTDEEYKIHGAGFAGYNAYTWGNPRSYGFDAIYEF